MCRMQGFWRHGVGFAGSKMCFISFIINRLYGFMPGEIVHPFTGIRLGDEFGLGAKIKWPILFYD